MQVHLCGFYSIITYYSITLRFLGGSDGKESAWNVGDLCLITGLGRSPGEGNGNPLQYSCVENSMDRGAWRATDYRVAKSWTWLTLSLSQYYTVCSWLNLRMWNLVCRGLTIKLYSEFQLQVVSDPSLYVIHGSTVQLKPSMFLLSFLHSLFWVWFL